MASSRKRASGEPGTGGAARRELLRAVRAVLGQTDLRGRELAVALSGGVDSVVLLHALSALAPEFGYRLRAAHVDHGLSPHAGEWRRFCAALCRQWKVPLTTRRVVVRPRGSGVEAAAREARYAVLERVPAHGLALGHQLDDQAETVLLNLLRGAGLRGASGMPTVAQRQAARGPRVLLRPLLEVPRELVLRYARSEGLQWVEDESNCDVALMRNYLRLEIAPRLAARAPRWRESLARAAGHFADAQRLLRATVPECGRLPLARLRAAEPPLARVLLRGFLAAHGLRPPSAARLAEMLRQIVGAAPDARTALVHEGAVLRVYRGELRLASSASPGFAPIRWGGERRVQVPALAGELRFRRVRGGGIDPVRLAQAAVTIRARAGGERLQPDPRRPRRSLKNLFQEAGIAPWERDALPRLYCGETLVWVPGLGVDAAFQSPACAAGLLPEWRAAGGCRPRPGS